MHESAIYQSQRGQKPSGIDFFPLAFVSVSNLGNTFLVNCTIQYWNKKKFNKAGLVKIVDNLT